MPISLYDASFPVIRQMLGSLSAVLEKGAAHAAARSFDATVLLQSRLYPDMFPLVRQVQVACDNAKGAAARLAGAEIPKHDDVEATFDELQARIARTLEFLNGIDRAAVDGQEAREIVIPLRDRTLRFSAQDYLLHWALPNLIFHVTTAYDILRHNGVEIGKKDFLGRLPLR